MDNQSTLIRVIAAGLPLLVIALVFGAIGFVTTDKAPEPVPQLADAAPTVAAAQGEITAVGGGRITLVTDAGATLDYALPPDVTVEALQTIELATIQLGDWLNGGAIPHADTLLALVGLLLLPDPVTP